MGVNHTGLRTLDKAALDPRVLAIDREAGTGDSRYTYTATLVLGWAVDGAHYPVGNSARDLLSELERIKPCCCLECSDGR